MRLHDIVNLCAIHSRNTLASRSFSSLNKRLYVCIFIFIFVYIYIYISYLYLYYIRRGKSRKGASQILLKY